MTTAPISAEILQRRILAAGIPVKYRTCRLTDWKPYNDLSASAHAAAAGFIESFPRRCVKDPMDTAAGPLIGKGLALVGPPGAGKTTLACIIATEVHLAHNPTIFFASVADYVALLAEQHMIKPQADRGVVEALERFWEIQRLKKKVRTVPVLVWDDMGKEHRTSSAMAVDEIDRLLRSRFRNGIPTVVTTNTMLNDWGSVYNPSMRSFAAEAFDEVLLGGKDLRRSR